MKYSVKTIQLLQRLREGERLSQGDLGSAQVKSIVRELQNIGAVVFSRTSRSRGVFFVTDRVFFTEACSRIDSTLADLDSALRLVEGEISSRAEKVALFGNSKQEGADRTVKGFTLLADRSVSVKYFGEDFKVCPQAGLHITNRKELTIPIDAQVFVVENPECFYDLRWFENVGSLPDMDVPRFVMCRYPVSEEGKLWLESIPNHVYYFGDFDLAGIRIYETEFKRRLNDKVSLIIPSDLEERVRNAGNPQLYTKHVNSGFVSVSSKSPDVIALIELLHNLQSGYEQEGYCMPLH